MAHEGTIYEYTKDSLEKILYVLTAVILSKKNFFGTKLLHAYVQYVYIVAAKYQNVPSKAVVGVDRSMKALSMHIQKPYK